MPIPSAEVNPSFLSRQHISLKRKIANPKLEKMSFDISTQSPFLTEAVSSHAQRIIRSSSNMSILCISPIGTGSVHDERLDIIDELLLSEDYNAVMSRLKHSDIENLKQEALEDEEIPHAVLMNISTPQGSTKIQNVTSQEDKEKYHGLLIKNGIFKRSIRAHRKYIEILKTKELDLASVELNAQAEHLQELADNLRANEDALQVVHHEKMDLEQRLEQALLNNRQISTSRDELERKVAQMSDTMRQIHKHVLQELQSLKKSAEHAKVESEGCILENQRQLTELVRSGVADWYSDHISRQRALDAENGRIEVEQHFEELIRDYELRIRELTKNMDHEPVREQRLESSSISVQSHSSNQLDSPHERTNMRAIVAEFSKLRNELIALESKRQRQKQSVLSALYESDTVKRVIEELRSEIRQLKEERKLREDTLKESHSSDQRDSSVPSDSSQSRTYRKLQSDIRRLRVKASQSDTQLRQAELHNQHLIDAVQQLELEAKLHERAKSQLQKEIARLRLSNDKLQKATTYQLQDSKDRLENVHLEKITLQGHVHRLTMLINEKTEAEQRMTQELDRLYARLVNAEQQQQQQQQASSADVKAMEKQFKSERDMLKQQITSLTQEIAALKCILDERAHDHKLFQAEKLEVEEHAQRLEKKLRRLKREVLKLRNREDKHIRRRSEYERKIIHLEEEKRDLGLRVEVLQQPEQVDEKRLARKDEHDFADNEIRYQSQQEMHTKKGHQTVDPGIQDEEPNSHLLSVTNRRRSDGQLEELEREIAKLEKDNAALVSRVNRHFASEHNLFISRSVRSGGGTVVYPLLSDTKLDTVENDKTINSVSHRNQNAPVNAPVIRSESKPSIPRRMSTGMSLPTGAPEKRVSFSETGVRRSSLSGRIQRKRYSK